MKTSLLLLTLLTALTIPAFAQGFIGGGLTTTITDRNHRSGPYLEAAIKIGDVVAAKHELGSVDAYAILFPDPGARFSIAFHPYYAEHWKVRPYVAIGGQWLNLAGRDEWHSTLGVGANLPKGFTVQVTRLHLRPQGWRPAFGYQHKLPHKLALRLWADLTVNRRAADYGVLSAGVVKTF